MTTDQTETHVVYGQNHWGAGPSLAEAKKQFQRHGGILSRGYAVMLFDADATFHGIDQMGRYHYEGNAPTETVHPARKQKSTQ